MSSLLLISICISLFIFLSNATVLSLLTNDGSYIDTESETALQAMCAQDPSSLSSWESYQCETINTRDGYQKCWAQRRMSKCSPGELRGIMLFYHGYSACPDAYNTISSSLQSECWHVYQPTTIGHGYTYCGEEIDLNTTDKACTAGKYNETTLPIQRQPYIDWIMSMNDIISDELSIIKDAETTSNDKFDIDALEVGVGGLSFGAPLAAASVVLSGTDSIFTKLVIMSPFFGLGYKGLDDLLYKCLANTDKWHDCLPPLVKQIGYNMSDDVVDILVEVIHKTVGYFVDENALDNSFDTFNLLVRRLFTWFVEAPERIADLSLLDKVNNALEKIISFGGPCEMDEAAVSKGGLDRGGFCRFALRKGLAAHSFSDYITQEYVRKHDMDQSVETLAIMVERDGKSRASLVNNYIQLFYSEDVSTIYDQTTDCLWPISNECQMESYTGAIDNTCGVPHACIAEKDNMLVPPYEMYWKNDYNGGIIDWLNNRAIESDNFIVKTQWDGSKNQCIYIDWMNPPATLFAGRPSQLYVTILGYVESSIKNDVLDAICMLTGTPRGVLELTYDVIHNVGEGIHTMSMILHGYGADVLKTLLENGDITDIGSVSTPNVTVRGKEYALSSNVLSSERCEDKEKNNVGENVGFMMIGIVIGVVLVVLSAAVFMKYKGYQVKASDKQYALMNEL